MNIIEIEKATTISQQEKSSEVSFNNSFKFVRATMIRKPNPTTIDNVKNLFLNGLDLNALSLHRAVNI